MPYFYRNEGGNNDINILFVHIPKTGGSSFENYLSQRYTIPLNRSSLFGTGTQGEKSTFQHIVLRDLLRRQKQLGIHPTGMKIIAFVRNPYDRIVSELFYIGAIDQSALPPKVAQSLHDFLNSPRTFDNHKLPQYEFVVDDQGNINKDVHIVHLESVQEDLAKLGFNDFKNHDRINKARGANPSIDYSKYLNDDSIQMIHDYYAKDFQLFGYDKKTIDKNNGKSVNESDSKNNSDFKNDSENKISEEEILVESMISYQENVPMSTLLGFLGVSILLLLFSLLTRLDKKSLNK